MTRTTKKSRPLNLTQREIGLFSPERFLIEAQGAAQKATVFYHEEIGYSHTQSMNHMEKTIMTIKSAFDACSVIEGFDGEPHDEEEIIEAFQYLIDTGVVWNLQGWYGSVAHSLIGHGFCKAAE